MPFDRHARLALVLAAAVLALSALGFRAAIARLNVYLRKEPVALREHFDNIPKRLGDWVCQRDTEKLSPEMVEELGTDLYFDRYYVDESLGKDARINLHITYYTGMIDAVPHVPDRCLVAAGFNARTLPENVPLPVDRTGWRPVPGVEGAWETDVIDPITGLARPVRLPRGAFELRTTEFNVATMGDARIYSGYFFIANDEVTPTPGGVKSLAFRPDQKFAYYCKVQFTAFGDGNLERDRFVALSSDLLAHLLPSLMRCLPDWADTTGGAAAD